MHARLPRALSADKLALYAKNVHEKMYVPIQIVCIVKGFITLHNLHSYIVIITHLRSTIPRFSNAGSIFIFLFDSKRNKRHDPIIRNIYRQSGQSFDMVWSPD